MPNWGCHTCARNGKTTMHYSIFLWLAKRRSMRHERRAHGFSVYGRNAK